MDRTPQEIAPECKLIFVGNKVDEREEGSGVSLSDATEFAARYGADCLECSAKSGEGVAEMFEKIAKELLQ